MHNYTGDPDAAFADPPVVRMISDGDDPNAANLNAGGESVADKLAAYRRYGAKLNAINAFTQTNTFGAEVDFSAKVHFAETCSRPAPSYLTDVADQTINPNVQATNLYMLPLTSSSTPASRIVRLATTSVTNGDWLRVESIVDVRQLGVWVFRRGADDSQDLCWFDRLNAGNSDHVQDGRASVTFQMVGGVWRVVGYGRNVALGAYA